MKGIVRTPIREISTKMDYTAAVIYAFRMAALGWNIELVVPIWE